MGTIPLETREVLVGVAMSALEEFIAKVHRREASSGIVGHTIVHIAGVRAHISQLVNSAYMRHSSLAERRGHRLRGEISEIVEQAANNLGFTREYVLNDTGSPSTYHQWLIQYDSFARNSPHNQAVAKYYTDPAPISGIPINGVKAPHSHCRLRWVKNY